MIARALLVTGALLVSPAWAQEPSFDLNSESVRKIVRATVATQYAEVQPIKLAPAGRKTASLMDLHQDVRLDEKPALKRAPPRRAPARIFQDPISELVDTLLDVENIPARPDKFGEWRACHHAGDADDLTPSYTMCPDKNRQFQPAFRAVSR
jgi:hypothetical protein